MPFRILLVGSKYAICKIQQKNKNYTHILLEPCLPGDEISQGEYSNADEQAETDMGDED